MSPPLPSLCQQLRVHACGIIFQELMIANSIIKAQNYLYTRICLHNATKSKHKQAIPYLLRHTYVKHTKDVARTISIGTYSLKLGTRGCPTQSAQQGCY